VVFEFGGIPGGGDEDGEDFGEGGVGEGLGHGGGSGDGDEGGAFIADGGGDELLGFGGEHVCADVAQDDEVEGGPLFAGGGEELGVDAGVGGGGFDGGGRGDILDACGAEEDVLEFEALVAGEVVAEVLVFPAGLGFDEEGEEFVFFDADAEGLGVIDEVGLAGDFEDADFVFVLGGVGWFIGEGGALDLLGGGGGAEGAGVEAGAVAVELDGDGLVGEAIEAYGGDDIEGIAFEDPLAGLGRFCGGIGSELGGADEEAVDVDGDAAGEEFAGGEFGFGAWGVVAAVGDDDDDGGFFGAELLADEAESGGEVCGVAGGGERGAEGFGGFGDIEGGAEVGGV
jgi:hypothetical protein